MTDPLRVRRPSRDFQWSEFRVDGERPIPWRKRWAYRRLCRRYLQPLRDRFGPVTVTSSLRSPAHNRAVGGAPASSHLACGPVRVAAADVFCQRGDPKQWAAFLDQLGAGGVGTYRSYVHCDTRRGRFRW